MNSSCVILNKSEFYCVYIVCFKTFEVFSKFFFQISFTDAFYDNVPNIKG